MYNKLNAIFVNHFGYLALGVFSISRLATWFFPFDSDHWIFYYIGRRWVQGATLYVDMWDHKSPIIFTYNSLNHILFGNNLVLQRIFFTFIALLGLWLFYKTSFLLYQQLKLSNYKFLAKISTLAFAFFANLSEFTNSGNNNENLGIIFLLAALYFYLRFRQHPLSKQNYLLLSGFFASFVFLLKANFLILLLPLLIDLIILQRKNIYRLLASISYAIVGSLLHLLLWALYFKNVGTFKQFYVATFEFNSKYIKALGWDWHAPDIKIFIGILVLLLVFFAPFLINAIMSLNHSNKNYNYLIPLMSATSIIFIIAAGTFYSHYFLIIIPYFCLVFGATYNNVTKNHKKNVLIVTSIIALILLFISFKQLYNTFYGSVAKDASSQSAVADYIRSNTSKDDKIFAYIYGATLYRLANRDSGSRFISASHLLIDYKYNFGYDFNRQFIYDMVDSEAKYVVMSSDPTDIYRTQNLVAMRFINNNYHLETQMNGYDILRKDSN